MLSRRTMFRMPIASAMTLGTALLLAACSSGAAPATAVITPVSTGAASSASAGPVATETQIAHMPTPATSAIPNPAPGSVRIGYYDNAEVEIVTSTGRHIFIDVYNAGVVSRPTAQDILLTSHAHDDHVDTDFLAKFPGQKITYSPGKIDLPDVKIQSINAEHNDGLLYSDHILVIDVEGMRIVHFGDLGETAIHDDQMAVIGDHVDIAFSQLYNQLSSMDETNNKGIHQMNQVKPLLFVPTHASYETLLAASKTWPSQWTKGTIVVSKDKLPAKTTMLLMGASALEGPGLGATPSGW